jgi:membrane protein DedA with SNARE-associated domain
MIAEILVPFVLEILKAVDWFGVFILMTAESTLLPVPSEAVLPFAGYLIAQGQMNLWIALAAATIGTITGAAISYAIGKYLGRAVVVRYGKYILVTEHDLDIAKSWFDKHGEKMIFICRFIPIVRHVISIPAGTAQMHFKKFLLYTAIGGLLWNAFLIYIGLQLQKNWEVILQYSQWIDILAIIVIVIAIIWFVKSRTGKNKPARKPTSKKKK